jgi:hypothetical protein
MASQINRFVSGSEHKPPVFQPTLEPVRPGSPVRRLDLADSFCFLPEPLVGGLLRQLVKAFSCIQVKQRMVIHVCTSRVLV